MTCHSLWTGEGLLASDIWETYGLSSGRSWPIVLLWSWMSGKPYSHTQRKAIVWWSIQTQGKDPFSTTIKRLSLKRECMSIQVSCWATSRWATVRRSAMSSRWIGRTLDAETSASTVYRVQSDSSAAAAGIGQSVSLSMNRSSMHAQGLISIERF